MFCAEGGRLYQKTGWVTVKGKKVKSVGKNAFKGIAKKAKLKTPASKKKAYKKLFKIK